MKNLKETAAGFTWNRAMVGLTIMGVVTVVEFVVVGVVASLGQPVPQEMWDTIRLTVVALAGAAAAQSFNGKVTKS